MAYQTNTSIAGHKALIGLLETFLTAQGWTINNNANASERFLHVSKTKDSEEFFFEIESVNADDVKLVGGVAHPLTADVSDTVYLNLTTGTIPQAWFFVGDLYCHVVVEVATGYFQAFGFGKLEPFFTFSSSDLEGSFVYGCANVEWSTTRTSMNHDYFSLLRDNSDCPSTIRCVLDSGVAWVNPYFALHSASVSNSLNPINMLLEYPNFNGDRIMMPIRIPLLNDPTTALNDSFLIGSIPSMAGLPLGGLINGSETVLGSDTWTKFPMPYFNNAIDPVSEGMALAFKQ